MADKHWMVRLQVTIRERDFIVRAVRPVTLPFVPFCGLAISFIGLNFTISGLDYDYQTGTFTAYSVYSHVEPEKLEAVIAIYKKNGFDIFDSGPRLAAQK